MPLLNSVGGFSFLCVFQSSPSAPGTESSEGEHGLEDPTYSRKQEVGGTTKVMIAVVQGSLLYLYRPLFV